VETCWWYRRSHSDIDCPNWCAVLAVIADSSSGTRARHVQSQANPSPSADYMARQSALRSYFWQIGCSTLDPENSCHTECTSRVVNIPALCSGSPGSWYSSTRQCTCNVTVRRVHVTTVAVERKSITYSDCVSVAFVIQHAERMRCIILSSVACLALPHFFHIISQTARFSKKKIIDNKLCFDFLYNVSLKHFSL
jgi:hypothetical protein